MYTKARSAGFTLIELLVVIAIIGILSVIVVASLTSREIKARDARRFSDIRQIQFALATYFDTNQTYPIDLVSLKTANVLPRLPIDPSTGNSVNYRYDPYTSASWGVATAIAGTCTLASPCSGYHLGISVEATQPASSAGVYPTAASATILKNAASNATKCNAADTGPGVNCYDVKN